MRKEKHIVVKGNDAGFSLLEVLLVVVVSAVAVIGSMKIVRDWQERAENSNIAEKLLIVHESARSYVQANFMEIWQNEFGENGDDLSSAVDFDGNGIINNLDICCVDASAELPVDLKAGNPRYLKDVVGNLPTDFPAINALGQGMTVFLRDAGIVGGKRTIEIFTITFSDASTPNAKILPETRAMEISRNIGPRAGTLPERMDLVVSGAEEMVTSSYGVWTVGESEISSLFTGNGYGTMVSAPTSGGTRAGSYLIVYESVPYQADVKDDVLYRVSLPSRPELNRMEANLDMDDRRISDAAYLVADNVQVAQNFILEEGERQAGAASSDHALVIGDGHLRVESDESHVSATTRYTNLADAVIDGATGLVVDDHCKLQGGWRGGGVGNSSIDPAAIGPCAVDGGVLTVAGDLIVDTLNPNGAALSARTLWTTNMGISGSVLANQGEFEYLNNVTSMQANNLSVVGSSDPDTGVIIANETNAFNVAANTVVTNSLTAEAVDSIAPLSAGTLSVSNLSAQSTSATTARIGGNIGALTGCTAPVSLLTPQSVLVSLGLSTWSCMPGTSINAP